MTERAFLLALYNACCAQENVGLEIRKVLSELPRVRSHDGLNIDSTPLWPSWRNED